MIMKLQKRNKNTPCKSCLQLFPSLLCMIHTSSLFHLYLLEISRVQRLDSNFKSTKSKNF